MHLRDHCVRLAEVPHLNLCKRPSPITPLLNVTAALNHVTDRSDAHDGAEGQSARAYLKDDSALSAVYGGNKTRKLEWILGDALALGARSVWTTGGLGSHHALATARHAAQLGLSCQVLQADQPLTQHARSVLNALRRTSAELTLAHPPFEGERASNAFKRQLSAWLGRDPREHYDSAQQSYYIPAGGSCLLGTLGYVEAGLELADQLSRGVAPRPDAIYLAAGSGSTAAGLTLGLRMGGVDTEVIGVAVTPRYLVSRAIVRRQISRAVEYLTELGAHLRSEREGSWGFKVLRGYIGAGYGHSTPEGEAARALAARDSLTLDPIYTAKAMAAMLDAERGRGRTALFWNTLATEPQQ